MKNNIIEFLNFRPDLNEDNPSTIIKTLPEWYKQLPKYLGLAGDEKPTLKSCVPFFDSMTSGYTLTTPCDIEFFVDQLGVPKANILDDKFLDFIDTRPPMMDVKTPHGYYTNHFHWYPSFAVKLPDGYSALYMSPLNRFELPFLTTSGIIDNDKVNIRGVVPFFLQKGFKGILPKGTPYVQIFPFKREGWESRSISLSANDINEKTSDSVKKYRRSKKNGYRKFDWQRKKYL